MTLAALLEDLKEVDAKIYDDISHLELIGWQQPRNQAMDHLQGCIQRACERREWHWLVCMDCWREGEYRAEMSIISESCISDMVEITTIAMKWGDSAAEALLAAYIAAVREEAKR